MAIAGDRPLPLGADAVGCRDQDRVLEPRLLEVEQGAEAANLVDHADASRRAGERP